ncbi:hypothetical protein B0H14DRAFT_964335 [Mycena olivaceomarginata]|nr:hypothetical protein B0H14DRAFT_964335 [Mycena olivaceomarginata]
MPHKAVGTLPPFRALQRGERRCPVRQKPLCAARDNGENRFAHPHGNSEYGRIPQGPGGDTRFVSNRSGDEGEEGGGGGDTPDEEEDDTANEQRRQKSKGKRRARRGRPTRKSKAVTAVSRMASPLATKVIAATNRRRMMGPSVTRVAKVARLLPRINQARKRVENHRRPSRLPKNVDVKQILRNRMLHPRRSPRKPTLRFSLSSLRGLPRGVLVILSRRRGRTMQVRQRITPSASRDGTGYPHRYM